MIKISRGLLLVLSSIALCAFTHPFYVSITSVDFNSNKKQVEISCRLFHDDLELALNNNQPQRIDIINPKSNVQVDSAVSKYIQQNFHIVINGQKRQMKFVGYEIQDDVAWCYFEIPENRKIKKIEIINQLLYKEFKNQSNILHVTVDKTRKSRKIDNPTKSAIFEF